MSATNSTSNYELPIFLATDKPAWLTDWNGAMNAIDTAIHAAQAAADGAQTTASAATADISTINASLTTITGNIQSLTTSVNSNTGAINTINSLIGNGEPTTSDKTLIGAINEIYGMITGGGGSAEIQAANVTYDNTSSGMTADDVQDAIDELHSSSNIAYDNTASGLTATNVKAALDELATGGSGSTYDFDLDPVSITPTFSSNFSAGTVFELSMLLNSVGDIGKIYGGGMINISGSIAADTWLDVFTISGSGIEAPSADYNVFIGSFGIFTPGSGGYVLNDAAYVRYVVKTTGDIVCQFKTGNTHSSGAIFTNFDPCVIFFKDLGD